MYCTVKYSTVEQAHGHVPTLPDKEANSRQEVFAGLSAGVGHLQINPRERVVI